MGNTSSANTKGEIKPDEHGSTTESYGVTIEKENIPNFKIVLIGDPVVGKSSIFLRYVKNQFNYEYKKTKKVVIENAIKTVNIPQKAVSSVTLWDIPGSEDMDLRSSYFRNVDAAIVVVDMNDPDSIELAGAWKQDFVNKASRAKFITKTLPNGVAITELEEMQCDPTTIPVLLVGNKYDLVEERIKSDMLKKSLRFGVSEQNDEETVEKNISKVEKELGLKENNELNNGKETKQERPFTSLRGPKTNEKKPESVQLLEAAEEEHGFVGSVMVSAKDGDGSADDAIQSLVRHLLTKHLPPKKKKDKEVQKKMDMAKQLEYKPLRETGKTELDSVFERCYMPLKRSGDYAAYYALVLKRLKQSCADAGLLDSANPSLEDCILGIRQALQAMGDMQLKATEENDFVVLDHTVNPHFQAPEEVTHVLGVFNHEYAMVCRSVLRDCPVIDAMLDKFDTKIAGKCEQIREIFPLEPESRIAVMLDVCENNRARIAFARGELKELLDTVQACQQKVHASLMW